MTAAHFDAVGAVWQVATAAGESCRARLLVLAVGCLSSTSRPDFPGLGQFRGAQYHTGQWPHAPVDFSAQRVAVIGTGSSGIQCIPKIAAQAARVVVYQRTPNYAIPAWNEPLDADADRAIKADYAALRARARQRPTGYWFPFDDRPAMSVPAEERAAQYERFWRLGGLKFMGAFSDLFLDAEANATAGQFVRAKIRAKIEDPAKADVLVPRGVIGSKRLCVESGYFETFNRPNVEVVDVRRAPIERFTAQGIVAGGGERPFDAVVFATGFDAVTGSILRIDIRGRGGLSLSEQWRERPKTYLGLATAGFPNLFMINAPGSPSVLSNMVQSIEQHVDFIMGCVGALRRRGATTCEANEAAQDAWGAHCQEVVARSVRAVEDSWYVGANIPGKPRVFLPYAGGFPAYVKKCEEVVAADYAGFEMR